MSAPRPDFYAQWRAQQEAKYLLRERDSPHPPERLLQSVWHHQRLRREDLRTLDGQPLRVLHPGFWNHEPGPDFRAAVLQFGQDEPRSGDIEVDLIPQNWQAHHHDRNPAFGNVILHVIWTADAGASAAGPALALEPFLDMPLNEMQTWAGAGGVQHWPESLRGACSAPLGKLNREQMDQLLQQAALVRFQRKARELENRARQAGWEQALWEGIFRALGYKQNVWAMQRLGELLPQLREAGDTLHALQARLLGVSGFLAATGGEPGDYARGLWDHWWREREKFHGVQLPKSLWRLYGLRPANQPQRRLALAAHWLAARDFMDKLEQWFTAEQAAGILPDSLLACLQPPLDDFWSWHWGFQTPRLSMPQPLLGESRATDLAINVILPWFWTRARAGKNEPLARTAEDRFLLWPAAQDNARLRLARQRLLGGQPSVRLRTAAGQQGLLQIIHDFCNQTNALCQDCSFPDLVRSFVS
ncbi:MAG: DUF2851 family protein [Verrucomicrobiota bacterium]